MRFETKRPEKLLGRQLIIFVLTNARNITPPLIDFR
jgi:hypothetical protein